jgi:hypothetical protein
MGLIEQEIEAMIQREVSRRVRAALKRIQPTMVEPRPVAPSNDCMSSRLGGDASRASGPHFAVYLNEARTEMEIHCPTFLRGPLRFYDLTDGRILGASY